MTKNYIEKIVLFLLMFSHFSVFAQREIFVNSSGSNGDGTEATPYNSFKTAVAQANNGDIIKLSGNVSETQYHQLGNGEVEPFTIDKAVTIDGQGNTLLIRAAPLSLTKDVTFKNIKLELPPLGNLVISHRPIEGESYIFVNGNRVVFDNVTTEIMGAYPETRPILIAGAIKEYLMREGQRLSLGIARAVKESLKQFLQEVVMKIKVRLRE